MRSIHELLAAEAADEHAHEGRVEHVLDTVLELLEAIGPEPDWQRRAACRGQTRVMFMMCIAFIDGFLDFTEALGASDQGGGVNRAKWFTEPIDLCRIVHGLSQLVDGPFDEHGS